MEEKKAASKTIKTEAKAPAKTAATKITSKTNATKKTTPAPKTTDVEMIKEKVESSKESTQKSAKALAEVIMKSTQRIIKKQNPDNGEKPSKTNGEKMEKEASLKKIDESQKINFDEVKPKEQETNFENANVNAKEGSDVSAAEVISAEPKIEEFSYAYAEASEKESVDSGKNSQIKPEKKKDFLDKIFGFFGSLKKKADDKKEKQKQELIEKQAFEKQDGMASHVSRENYKQTDIGDIVVEKTTKRVKFVQTFKFKALISVVIIFLAIVIPIIVVNIINSVQPRPEGFTFSVGSKNIEGDDTYVTLTDFNVKISFSGNYSKNDSIKVVSTNASVGKIGQFNEEFIKSGDTVQFLVTKFGTSGNVVGGITFIKAEVNGVFTKIEVLVDKEVSQITLNQTMMTISPLDGMELPKLYVGQTATLRPKLTAANNSENDFDAGDLKRAITWLVTNADPLSNLKAEDILTISADGLITAKQSGKVNIRAQVSVYKDQILSTATRTSLPFEVEVHNVPVANAEFLWNQGGENSPARKFKDIHLGNAVEFPVSNIVGDIVTKDKDGLVSLPQTLDSNYYKDIKGGIDLIERNVLEADRKLKIETVFKLNPLTGKEEWFFIVVNRDGVDKPFANIQVDVMIGNYVLATVSSEGSKLLLFNFIKDDDVAIVLKTEEKQIYYMYQKIGDQINEFYDKNEGNSALELRSTFIDSIEKIIPYPNLPDYENHSFTVKDVIFEKVDQTDNLFEISAPDVNGNVYFTPKTISVGDGFAIKAYLRTYVLVDGVITESYLNSDYYPTKDTTVVFYVKVAPYNVTLQHTDEITFKTIKITNQKFETTPGSGVFEYMYNNYYQNAINYIDDYKISVMENYLPSVKTIFAAYSNNVTMQPKSSAVAGNSFIRFLYADEQQSEDGYIIINANNETEIMLKEGVVNGNTTSIRVNIVHRFRGETEDTFREAVIFTYVMHILIVGQ